MRATILANVSAGRLREDPTLLDRVARRFAEAGVDADLRRLKGAAIDGEARRTLDSTADRVIVAGGDGTVRSVAQVFAGSDKPLGILPLGTLNHFARDLGIPVDSEEEAATTLATGPVARIDVGEVNGQVFVNNSSIGIYSQMVLERDAAKPRTRRRKFLAMAAACARVLYRFPLLTAEMETKGERTALPATPLIMISNNPYSGPWPHPATRDRLDTGQLGIYPVRCSTRLGLMHCAWDVFRGRMDSIGSIEPVYAPQVTIRSRHRRLMVSLDGEVVRLTTPLVYQSRKLALHVVRGPGESSESGNGKADR